MNQDIVIKKNKSDFSWDAFNSLMQHRFPENYKQTGGGCWKSGNQTCCNKCAGCDVSCFSTPS